jgi:succinate dehydrogenase / fumarate reductase membrane anchor subunit
MVKSVLSTSHRGFKDWFVQRLSAVLMAVYVIGLLIFFAVHPHLDFKMWKALFAHSWMQIATLFALASILLHAWVGMWTILTDYVNCTCGRVFLNVVIFLSLVTYFIWGLRIVWGV